MAGQFTTTCKDCGKAFYYSEASYRADRERGYSRPERCPSCRRARQREINNAGIGYYPVKLVRDLPPGFVPQPGILGRIHHQPRPHRLEERPSHLAKYRFGITDDDVRQLYGALETKQVAVIEGPTGSGKSTFLPYRLMVPPSGVRDPQRFTRTGQIVVTQPRRLPTRNIPKFVAESLHGSGLGPGFDVGYKHAGSPETDRRNRLVFVTDGTLINWLVNEQIGHCSAIMIDEAHERSVNIDLILGLLRARLPRHPRLKVIIASATINAEAFIDYFGGPAKVAHLKYRGLENQVEENFAPHPVFDYNRLLKKPSKRIDEAVARELVEKALEVLRQIQSGGPELRGDVLAFIHSENCANLVEEQLKARLKDDAALAGVEAYALYRDQPEHVHNKVLENKAQAVADKVILALRRGTRGRPILAFLLDDRMAAEAAEILRKAIDDSNTPEERKKKVPLGQVDVRVVHEKQSGEERRAALEPTTGKKRRVVLATYAVESNVDLPRAASEVVEDRRVIVATNVAETSLTVDGVVHVIDTGLIKQNTFDPDSRTQRLESKCHSQAGCRQRRGRAGRIRPGFAHYLYTREQFDAFEPYTPPETERAPLDDLLLAAKAAGLANPEQYEWLPVFEAKRAKDEGSQEKHARLVAELGNARTALVERGALDSDGDLTERGLELRELTLEPEVASLLLNADRLCCAVEMATLLPLLTLRLSFRRDLFRWNSEWDAQTRWEARQRQQALWLGCADDVELVLKLIAAWEASGRTDEERAAWAAQLLVNHEVIVRQILPERGALLQRLAAGMRGEAVRPLQMELLDRVRLVMAHSLPERVGPSAGLTIAPESVLYQRPCPLVVYAGQMPYKDLATGGAQVRVRLLARLEPAWFADRPPGQAGLLEMARLAAVALRESSGALRPHAASAHLALTQFPLDSTHECQLREGGAVREVILGKRIGLAGPLREQAGRHRGAEAEAAGLEAQAAKPEWAEPPVSRRPARRVEDDEETGAPAEMAEPGWGARLRLFLADAPPEWQMVDVYLDGVKELERVAVGGGQTDRLEVAAGDHELTILPAGKPLADESPRARARLRSLEPATDYVVVMSGWTAKGAPDYYVMPDRLPEFRAGRAALRWTHVGFSGPAPVVLIAGRDKETRPSGYYSVRTDRPCKVQVYRQGDHERGKPREGTPPLAEREFKLAGGRAYTLVVTRMEGKAPRLTLLADRAGESSERRGRERGARVVARLIEGTQPAPAEGRFAAVVAGYSLPEGGTPVLWLRPQPARDPFATFAEQYSPGEAVEVEPVAVDEYPEVNQSALVVREPATGLEVAVALEDLLFDRWGAGALLRELSSMPRVSLQVDWIDRGRRRVYLSRLGKLAEALNGILDSQGEALLKATVLEAVRQEKVSGLAVRLEPAAGYALGGLVWEQSLRAGGARAPESFAAGEKIEVRLRFIGGKVKADRVAIEVLDAARAISEGRDLRVRNEDGERTLRLERRMTAQELAALLKVDRSADYQWAVTELYRRSNQPRLEYVDRARLEALERLYAPGAIITGCRVTAVREKAVEVLVPPDYSGYVPISEWANYRVASLADETRVGEELALQVIERTQGGELRLSRLQAALAALEIGQRFVVRVARVYDDRAELRLVSTERGEPIPSLRGVVWKRHFARELPGEAGGPRPARPPTEGEAVTARVIELNRDKGMIELTIRRAFEGKLYLDAAGASRVGLLFGKGGERIRAIERQAGAEIRVERQADASGGKTVEVASHHKEGVGEAVREIRGVIPTVVVMES